MPYLEKVKVKIVPLILSEATSMFPSWPFVISFAINSPRPKLVVGRVSFSFSDLSCTKG